MFIGSSFRTPTTLIVLMAIVVAGLAVAFGQRQSLKTSVTQDAAPPPSVAALTSSPNRPLLQKSNFTSLGAFRLKTGESFFSYQERAMGFYRDGAGKKTIFLSGHTWHQKLGQVEIPATLSKAANWNGLPQAPVLQNPVEVTEGKLGSSPLNPNRLGGVLPFNGRLIVAGYVYYDGNGEQRLTHGTSSLDLSKSGDFSGFTQLSNAAHARTKGGYMGLIPAEWQELFGGPALTGTCCLAIISASSTGPAAHVFNPDDIGVKNPVPAIPLVYNPYPIGNCGKQSSEFNCTTVITGIAFPEGTSSVLFFGTQGTGPICYKCDWDGDGNFHGGYDAPPYHSQVWAFDAAELLKVKQGEKSPQSVKPYAIWQMDDIIGSHIINGVAYDAVEQRLYVESNSGETPAITVLQLDTAVVAPKPEPAKVSNLIKTITDDSISFVWQTTAAISMRLDFALADDFKKPLTVTSPEGTDHSIKLTDLIPCTVYRYRLTSLSESSKATENGKFITSGCVGKASVQDETSGTIDAKQGGKLNFNNGTVELNAPADFNTVDTNFQIKQLDRTQAETATSKPEGLNALSNWYQIHALEDPSAIKSSFSQPLSITLAYTVDDSVSADTIKAYRHDGTSWQELTNCTVNQEAKTITCPLDHFSLFGVFGGGSFTAPAATPTPTPVIIAQNTSSGGGDSGGGGGGGGGDSNSGAEATPGRIYTYQAEKGKLTGPVIKKDGKLTIALFTKDADRLAQAYKVDAGTYRLSFSAKDGLPKATKVAIYLNGKAWKVITLNRGDNKYLELIAGNLKNLRTGTISFRLVNPLPTQTLSLDWWRLTQVK